MYDTELEYSYSGGQYWSKYPHCRVFENGSYEVVVRDNFGQTSTAYLEVTNNVKKEIEPPTVQGINVEEYGWITTNPSIQFTAPNSEYYIDVKFTEDEDWNLATSPGNREIGLNRVDGTKTIIGRCRDIYGNVSLPITFVCYVDCTAPTNINFVPEVTYANKIMTTVTAVENIGFPMRYSITYDNGKTWSTPQIGRKFGLINPAKGTYQINCRAYNPAGLYVEGTMVERTITDTIQ